MIRVALVLIAASAIAAEDGTASSPARWHYVPNAGYEEEPLHVELAEARGWRVVGDDDRPIEFATGDDGSLRAVIEPRGRARVRALAADGGGLGLRLVRPGGASDLSVVDDALRLGDDTAVLILSRIDARADRRWSLLRSFSGVDHSPCALRLVGDDILGLAVAAQEFALSGQGVLVVLPSADRLIGWKHREYRQIVGWIVADACARGAAAVVLVEPCAPDAEAELIRPLVRAARDVAKAYQCQIASATALSDHRYWEVAPGVLGSVLNDPGRKRLDEIVAPWAVVEPAR
ncbi:MAG: hypothetical protein H0X45_04790 [Planctomycetes bacterium]|nr:hypothetical protein [Planctomycetota bacterium]